MYGLRQIPYFIRRYIFWQDVEPEQLYEKEGEIRGEWVGVV